MFGTLIWYFGDEEIDIEDGLVDCSSYPRLAKLAARSGKVPEGKVRSLAGRFRVELPPSTDLTDAAKVKWVWGLASLSQSITVRGFVWRFAIRR